MIHICERKRRLSGRETIYQCELVALSPTVGILKHVLNSTASVGNLQLKSGTVTYAFYWTDRMYNLYWWMSPEHETLAYYFNIADSTILNRNEFVWRDLSVDVLVMPDEPPRILDEDELPESMEIELLQRIRDATAEVIAGHTDIIRRAHSLLDEADIGAGPSV